METQMSILSGEEFKNEFARVWREELKRKREEEIKKVKSIADFVKSENYAISERT